MAGIYLYI